MDQFVIHKVSKEGHHFDLAFIVVAATQVTRGAGGQGTGDYEWLSPELDGSRSRAGMRELLRDALVANNKEMVVRYYELGRQDATSWLSKYQAN